MYIRTSPFTQDKVNTHKRSTYYYPKRSDESEHLKFLLHANTFKNLWVIIYNGTIGALSSSLLFSLPVFPVCTISLVQFLCSMLG